MLPLRETPSAFPIPDWQAVEQQAAELPADTIQDLWSGRGFNRQDEGQRQSYHLAKVLTHMLTGDRPRFLAFLHDAHFSDARAASLLKHFDLSLETLVSDYLGEGPWSPLPFTQNLHSH